MNKEMINHPQHYNMGKYEAIDVIEDWQLNFNLGNTVACHIRCYRTGYFEKLTRQFISGAKESYKSRLLACRQGKLLLGR